MAARVTRVLALGVALMLHTPHKLFAAAYAPPIAMEVGPSVIAVGDAVGVTVRPATLPYFGGAKILISWTGSGETSALDTTYYLYYTANASFTGITPGVFDVFATADWSAVPENMGYPPSSCISTASAPASVTVVAVTNVTASAYHVAEGAGPVTLTAQMTPVNAPDLVTWELVEGGGSFSTTQGLTTQFNFGAGWSSNRVAARCGTNRTEVLIHIYRVTGITATPQPAVAGEPITLTAITEPANCPLPITWNISTNTGASITNTFGPGTHTVIASLGAGTITQTLNVVSVGVKEILYEWPANSDNWLPWSGLTTGVPPLPATAAVAVGSSFRVKALPEPEGAEFPAGWPVWSGLASGSGPIATATFASVSTNLSDYQSVTATSGTSSRTEQAVVFGLDSILVATNHVAIGTNTLTLTPQMTPVTGGEHLVVWDCTNATLTIGSGASVEFPTDQAGIFTATATCGSSAASTNLFVYRLASIAASADPVGEGDPVVLSVTTEPASCPLPITWNVSTNTGASITNALGAGTHTVIASLGTSTQTISVVSAGVKEIQYQVGGAWVSLTNLLSPGAVNASIAVGTTLQVKAIPNPEDATFPSGKPVWGGEAVGTGPEGTATFGAASTNLSDFKLVTATSGTSSKTEQALVYQVDSISTATNHIAVGTNAVILTAQMTPASGGEHLVSWAYASGTNALAAVGQGGSVSFTCYEFGTYTFTATCGSSSAAKVIVAYAVTGLTLSTNVAKLGETVTATATVEPGGNPLPLVWSGGGTTAADIGSTVTLTNAPLGESQIGVSLGTSGSTNVLTVVNVQILQRTNYACAGSAETAGFSLTNSFGPVEWTLTPANAVFPPTLSDPSAAAVEVTPGQLAGTFTVTCKSTLRPDVSDAAALIVFAIRHPLLVKHPDGGPDVDCKDKLNVLLGQSATFTATNVLARTFPADVPVWSYVDSLLGANATKTAVFRADTQAEDRFLLAAKTGLPSANHSICVGRYVLGIHTKNVSSGSESSGSGGSSPGHAWISVTDRFYGTKTTYGLWPDEHPDYPELNNGPGSDVRVNFVGEGGTGVSRFFFLKPFNHGLLMSFVSTHATYSLLANNCSGWASSAVQAATGESLSAGPLVSTPSVLGSSISAAEAGGVSPTDVDHPFGASFRLNLFIVEGF